MKKEDAIIEEATGLLEGRVAEDGSWIFASDADKKKGFQTLMTLAQSGNQVAQLKIGKCYLEAAGTSLNEKEGIRWIETAAAGGYDEALMELGHYFLKRYEEHIDRTDKTLQMAHDLMKQAADLGNRLAASKLERCTPEYHRECEREFCEVLAAAEAGDPGAQKMIHFQYLSGYGVKRSDEKAAFWIAEFEKNKPAYMETLKQRAESGDQRAELELHVLRTGSALG
jgi:TPR repeat protein